jgi:hypothetical protein
MARKKKGTEFTPETEPANPVAPAAKPARTTRRAAETPRRKQSADAVQKTRAPRRKQVEVSESSSAPAAVAAGSGSNGNGSHAREAVPRSQVGEVTGVFEGVSLNEQIALLAYSYWEARGQQGGSPEEDWLRAERELFARLAPSPSEA